MALKPLRETKLFRGIKDLIRPVDAEGNPIPLGTIEVSISNASTIKIGLIIVSAIIINKIISDGKK